MAVVLLGVILNVRWLHAAAVAALAESCDESLVARASEAVSELYGSIASKPVIGCVNMPTLGMDVSHGLTSFGPALPPIVLISPEGRGVDVIAHELAHAELIERIGFVSRELAVPTWFDEGLAMQVDHREPYGSDALAAFHDRSDLVFPSFEEMSKSSFFAPGEQGKYHYAYSKCVVQHWVSVSPDWLSKLTEIDILSFHSMLKNAEVCRGNIAPFTAENSGA